MKSWGKKENWKAIKKQKVRQTMDKKTTIMNK
jgi:hypothetical protein